jgi:hypothetical protein
MNKIFVLKRSKFITGPFSIEQLKETGLKSSDKVWYEGVTDWQPAATLQSHGIQISESSIETAPKTRSMMFWKKHS